MLGPTSVMASRVNLEKDVAGTIARHAMDTYPEECCGILVGSTNDEGIEVRFAVEVSNSSRTHREQHYTIDAATLHTVTRDADRVGLDIVGFYHSHPDHPARPSATDLTEATFPNYVYLIQSVARDRVNELTAWTLAADRSRFLPLSIEYLTTPTTKADLEKS